MEKFQHSGMAEMLVLQIIKDAMIKRGYFGELSRTIESNSRINHFLKSMELSPTSDMHRSERPPQKSTTRSMHPEKSERRLTSTYFTANGDSIHRLPTVDRDVPSRTPRKWGNAVES